MNRIKRNITIGAALFSAAFLSACGGGSSSSDSGPDGDGTADTGTTDTEASDTATADMGTTDTGTTGTGTTDVGTPDTGTPDTGTPDTGTSDTGMTDTSMNDFTDNTDIPGAILGAWVSDCEVLASTNQSARQIFVFNASQLIRDWHEYDGDQCSGVPRGKRYPLLVDDYTLGADIVTSDAIAAVEIDLVLKQLPETDYKPGFGAVVQTGLEVGDGRYTVVSYVDGKVLWQDREPTNADNRFTNFNNALELTPYNSLTSADISVEALYGVYESTCRARDDGTYSNSLTIIDTENVERLQDHLFFNSLCLGEADAITETPTTLEFGAVFTSDFGDTMLSAIKTRQQQFVVKGEDLIDFELKAPRASRFGAYALSADTLLVGDCIIRVDECKNSSVYPANHVDYEFNSSVRYVRTDPNESIQGSTDTMAIAGTWDATYDLAAGGQDIYYYVITDNGLITFYDYQNDPLGNGDDCYSVYTENLTNYGNNQYLYEGFYENGDPYSYAEIVTVENNELTFTNSAGEGTTVPQFTGDLSSLNECT